MLQVVIFQSNRRIPSLVVISFAVFQNEAKVVETSNLGNCVNIDVL